MPKRKRTSSIPQPKSHPIPNKQPFSQYLPLSEDLQEVRIVTLHAGADDAPISCTIETLPLAQAQPFNALSYCWGSAGDVAEITLNGELINIRKNLSQFLLSLRNLNGTIRIWVDYVCINQEDVNERNHQVHMMADIYKSALTVYSWLGQATKSSDEAIDHINGLPSAPIPRARSTPATPQHLQHRLQKLQEQLPSDLQNGSSSVRVLGPDRSPRDLARRALQRLIDREYWTRLWIVQEVLLARELLVVVGYKTVRWNQIVDIFSANHGRHQQTAPKNKVFKSILKLTAKQMQDPCFALSALVSDFSMCLCFEPKDRIYGMLGLLRPEIRNEIQIDYQQTVVELCVRNVKYLANHLQLAPYPNLRIYDADFVRLIANVCGRSSLSSELRRWEEDRCLRLGQNISLVFDASISYRPQTFETFAAMKTLNSQWEPFTVYNHLETSAVYLTRVKVDRKPQYDVGISNHNIAVYSTVLPCLGDLLIFAFPYLCIVRQAQQSLRVPGTAAVADTVLVRHGINYWLPYSPGVANHIQPSVCNWVNPSSIPDICFVFEASPSTITSSNPGNRSRTDGTWVRWPLRLNGPAIAEAMRLCTQSAAPEVLEYLLWNPSIYISSHALTEPTRAQYHELSQRMRMRTRTDENCRGSDLTFSKEHIGWYNDFGERIYLLTSAVSDEKFNSLISQARTDPLTIPAIAAAVRDEKFNSLMSQARTDPLTIPAIAAAVGQQPESAQTQT